MSAVRNLFDWADERDALREKHLRSVRASLARWEGNPTYAHLVDKYRHAEAVMVAGGDCPLRPATMLDIMEAIAAVGVLIGTAVGPHRLTRKSPVELVADFHDRSIPIDPALIQQSRERGVAIRDMIHGQLAAAGHPVTGVTQQQFWEGGLLHPAKAARMGEGDTP